MTTTVTCENCGDPKAPNIVFPADKIGPVNVCDSCRHFYEADGPDPGV
jgi:DNA-directed RNA polymerase subunit M/transcription elongation factor TFIIS